MDEIPYFDAHCDTISPLRGDGVRTLLPATRSCGPSTTRAGAACAAASGHIDLERAGARLFALRAVFRPVSESATGCVPEGSASCSDRRRVLLSIERFLREMEENRERIRPLPHRGGEMDARRCGTAWRRRC